MRTMINKASQKRIDSAVKGLVKYRQPVQREVIEPVAAYVVNSSKKILK